MLVGGNEEEQESAFGSFSMIAPRFEFTGLAIAHGLGDGLAGMAIFHAYCTTSAWQVSVVALKKPNYQNAIPPRSLR
jgi:hypothetical protein